MANHVQPTVLRQLITVQQLDRLTSAEDELWIRDKFVVANLGQKKSSCVVVLARTNFSFGVQVQITTDLEFLGSNKVVCRVPPL